MRKIFNLLQQGNGIYLAYMGTGSGPILPPCEGNVSKYLHSKNWLYFLLLPLALGKTQQALTVQMVLEPPSFLERAGGAHPMSTKDGAPRQRAAGAEGRRRL